CQDTGLHRQGSPLKLWNKYRISNIPSLIFLDATTGKVVCRNGLLVIRDDPEGKTSARAYGPLITHGEAASPSRSCCPVFQCPPCRSLTRVLVESYRKIKEAGQSFEIIFVSADRSVVFCMIPWLRLPVSFNGRVLGIPTLIVLDPQGEVITRQGRVEVLNDEDCREFPWHPKPVLELSDSNATQLNEGPCLVLFVGMKLTGGAWVGAGQERPHLGGDDMTDSLRDYTNLPEAAPLLTILDMSARAKYVMDVEEITPAIVEAFVNDFLAEKLKPEPI
uniref:Thioredoxin-like fold domain-containing protein n=1 Tax=Mandrillus leucophaeus TaxID=9568 RepID=A0A2K5ZJ48_MANLE